MSLLVIIILVSGIIYLTLPFNKNDKSKKIKSLNKFTATSLAKVYLNSNNHILSNPSSITITAGGDVIFDRKVRNLISSSGGEAPLAKVASYFQKADVAIVNLESPVSLRGTRKADKDVTFRGDPEGIKSLYSAGIDFASLANNHALDYGLEALDDTMALLRESEIEYTGAGRNKDEAERLAIKKLNNGVNVGFLAYSYIIPPGFMSSENKAGIATVRPENYQEIKEKITESKRRVDYLIVHFHWGMEYQDYPLNYQKELGHMVIDSGADLVLAEHPHVIQGLEIYKEKLIAYSLGDFVFDHFSRKTGEAFILELTINSKGLSEAKITPVYLTPQGQPEVATGQDAQIILNRLEKISQPFQTKIEIIDEIATIRLK